MLRLAAPLTLAALAALSACSAPPQVGGPAQPGANIVTNVHPYRAGSGTVQAVMSAPKMASAGSTAEPMQRLEIKMDDGQVQYIDTLSREFPKGTRIVLTEDKQLRRL